MSFRRGGVNNPIALLQVSQINTFLELKRSVESGDLKNIQVLVRRMIKIGLELEMVQAQSKTRILLNPIDHYKRA